MSDYIGVITNIGQAKIAAAIGGTALNPTTIRVGDGNGAPITPNAAMTDLVRRVGVAYPIISSGRDPVNANHWRVTALIPVDDGPFDIREIGVWDAAGDMIAVAKHVLVEKRSPAQGAAVELLTDIVFPVSETAQVTVQVTPSAQVSIFQLLRAGFTVVESATLANPPGAPVLGQTHVVPAGATGAWNGLAGYLVQWNGIVWVAVNIPTGFVVVDQSKDRYAGNRWLERTATGWDSGLTRLIQRQPGNAVTATGTANALSLTLDPVPASWGDLVKVPLNVEISDTNTGPATVAVVGLAGTKPLIHHDGSPLQENDLLEFSIQRMIFDGTYMRVDPVLSWSLIDTRIRAFARNGRPSSVRVYNASDTWTKPANLNFVRARLCGGGASGGVSSGVGGGVGRYWGGAGGNAGYVEAYIMAADLGATQAVTLGAGGAARLIAGGAQTGAAGGGSQFSYLFAAGGLAGGGVAGGPGDFGEGGGFTLNPPAVGYGVQGSRGMPGNFFGTPVPGILGLYGRGGNGGSVDEGANGVAGSDGIVIIEEYLLP